MLLFVDVVVYGEVSSPLMLSLGHAQKLKHNRREEESLDLQIVTAGCAAKRTPRRPTLEVSVHSTQEAHISLGESRWDPLHL